MSATFKTMADMLDKTGSEGRRSSSTDHSAGYDPLWMVTSDEILVREAARRLAGAAPEARVILFGSRARGDSSSDSDLDLLVIEPHFENRGSEFVRLRRALRGLEVPIDLVLVSDRHVEEWGHFEGTLLNEALREGRVLAGA